jgi:hypothetical protein
VSVTVADMRSLSATAVFDVEDRYARDRGVRGPHPRPIAPVRFRAVARVTTGGRVDLDHELELDVVQNGAGFGLFYGNAGPAGADAPRRLEDGTYVVRVLAGGVYQPVERPDIVVPTPSPAYGFDLDPGYAYPFPSGVASSHGAAPTLLRGALQARDASGIAGARVEVAGTTRAYTTDEAGQWVLVFPETQGTGPVTIRIELPDGTVTNVTGVQVIAGRDSVLAQTALRGTVTTADGVPLAGATVTVGGQPGSTRSQGDGGWFYFFRPDQPATNVTVTATLPDGRSQSRGGVPVQPRSTVVVQSFRIA